MSILLVVDKMNKYQLIIKGGVKYEKKADMKMENFFDC